MDAALQFEVANRESEVFNTPFINHLHAKVILKIGFHSSSAETEYGANKVLFSYVNVLEAINMLDAGEPVDAIFIHPHYLTLNTQVLKRIAKEKAIPFILYTSKFDQAYKKVAFEAGMDDYFFGNLTSAFGKRIDFIRKLKVYKNHRGEKPYEVHAAADEIKHIKIWSLKRSFDILVSFTSLLLLSPLMALIAVIIKLESKGPVFYISKRAGSGYKIFNFYKFRTMRVGADQELQKLTHLNQYHGNTNEGVFFKLQNDPRVTKFGAFLRNTSLDEIPQLINVLIGDMSLVGNRPLPLYEAEKLTKDQIAWRFLAPAGITGLWQITKRGKDNMSELERIQLDMQYAIQNSFLLDMKILLSTFPALLQKSKV